MAISLFKTLKTFRLVTQNLEHNNILLKLILPVQQIWIKRKVRVKINLSASSGCAS